jgi:hypothetical protein
MKMNYEVFNTGTFGLHKFHDRVDFCFGRFEVSLFSSFFRRFRNGSATYTKKKGFEAGYFRN